jgi:hypothetical protein
VYSLVDQVSGMSSSQERGEVLLQKRVSVILSKCWCCYSAGELSRVVFSLGSIVTHLSIVEVFVYHLANKLEQLEEGVEIDSKPG